MQCSLLGLECQMWPPIEWYSYLCVFDILLLMYGGKEGVMVNNKSYVKRSDSFGDSNLVMFSFN